MTKRLLAAALVVVTVALTTAPAHAGLRVNNNVAAFNTYRDFSSHEASP